MTIVAATAINSAAPVWNHAGNVVVDGDLLVTGDITDLDGGYSTVNALRIAYDNHVHGNVYNGDGVTSTTDRPV